MSVIVGIYKLISDLILVLSDLITIGGVGRLDSAKEEYQKVYEQHELQRQRLNSLYQENKRLLESVGEHTKESFVVLKKACRILQRAKLNSQIANDGFVSKQASTNTIERTKRLNARYSSFLHSSAGAVSGSSLAIGSWTMVTVLGTATTGTAIGTLSGVAAFNATLAWFGGGALAAGGAGMAGGMMVLGGIVAFPFIIFWGFTIHKKAKKLEEGCKALKIQIPLFDVKETDGIIENKAIKTKHDEIRLRCTDFKTTINFILNEISPYGFFSLLGRRIQHIFGKKSSQKERLLIDKLAIEVDQFLLLFDK